MIIGYFEDNNYTDSIYITCKNCLKSGMTRVEYTFGWSTYFFNLLTFGCCICFSPFDRHHYCPYCKHHILTYKII